MSLGAVEMMVTRCMTMRWVSAACVSRMYRLLVLALVGAFVPPVSAEYADIVLNHQSEAEGMRPVIFPHWFHRIRFQCRVCHTELGFKMRVGATKPSMDEISNGVFCGACHDGDIAWSVDNCGLCHSARRGTPAGIIGGHETLGPGVW